MRRALRTRARKKVGVKTPGKRHVTKIRQEKHSYEKCGVCGHKLNKPKLTSIERRRLPTTKKRPERPYPELCSPCMRIKIKEIIR
ncbi:MAG: 50S ribosomal protein L34e [Candidatus Aenigmarchaeota archaeon]|nr:50S ribosomal protein L34e [Candidatus Aenigmarchaeota archaeon]